jgi:phage gp37-like protein
MTISATTQGIRPGVCTSSNRPAVPFDGQVIYMTDVDQTAVWDGTQWTVLAPIAGGRNVIINGAMEVAQRTTSTASITTAGYYTADRFQFEPSSMGTWTMSVENDAPTGSGFRKSTKLLCTTADASPAASDFILFWQRLEGQNIQQFLKGTSSAKPFALSFWVKSTSTGTYNVELLDNDNTRIVSAAYTVDVAATWEKKTVIFPADTTGAFDNDNASSLQLVWWLGAGTNYSSGTRDTLWGTVVQADRAVGQTNLASAINNAWQITGVQLEASAVVTPFEFEDAGVTLAKCQRYFSIANGGGIAIGAVRNATSAYCAYSFPVEMRSAPTATLLSGAGALVMPNDVGYTVTSISTFNGSTRSTRLQANIATSSLTNGFAVVFQCGTAITDGFSLSSEL